VRQVSAEKPLILVTLLSSTIILNASGEEISLYFIHFELPVFTVITDSQQPLSALSGVTHSLSLPVSYL